MRVAVVGGTGFIGHHVTRRLVEAGADVTAVHRGRTPTLVAAAPAVVVDMVAYTAEDTEGLLAALPPSVTRLVVISSGDVYWTYAAFPGLGPVLGASEPLDEQAALREQLYPYRDRAGGPTDMLYEYEKIEVERTARTMAEVPVTILRLPMVYGPGDPQRRVAGYLERLGASGGRFRLNAAEAAWRCTRGYVEDVAAAIGLAALGDRAAGETFNVGEEEALTELEWVRAIAAAAGCAGRVIADPGAPPSLPAAWEISLVVNTRRIREVLEYREPVGRSEGLRRTAGEPPPRDLPR